MRAGMGIEIVVTGKPNEGFRKVAMSSGVEWPEDVSSSDPHPHPPPHTWCAVKRVLASHTPRSPLTAFFSCTGGGATRRGARGAAPARA
eukprot:202498-Chlamydomonas_euryale.AAC.1